MSEENRRKKKKTRDTEMIGAGSGRVEEAVVPPTEEEGDNQCVKCVDWVEENKVKAGVIIGVILVVLIVVIVPLIVTSLGDVEWDQFAFRKNTVTNLVDRSRVYTFGRHMWGPSTTSVVFPRYYQLIEFKGNDLQVFAGKGNNTMDQNSTTTAGLEFAIECSIWYRLNENNLADIFDSWGLTYHDRFVDAVRASLKNTAPEFSVDDYVERLREIETRLFQEVNKDLMDLKIQIEKGKLVLKRVSFPGSVLGKYEETVLKKVEIENEILKRDVELFEKETEEILEGIRGNMTLIMTDANATADAVVLEASAAVVRIRQEALGRGINHMMKRLNITDEVTRNKVFQLYTIEDNVSKEKILLGDGNNLISVGK